MSQSGRSNTITGLYFDGRSSAAQPFVLSLADDGTAMLFESDAAANAAPIESWHYDQLTISSRLGNTPRSIRFPDGGLFETPENDAVDAWQSCCDHSRWFGVVHFLESHKRFVIGSVAVLLLVLWVFVRFVIPATSSMVAAQLPQRVTQQLGEHSLELLDAHVFSPSRLSEQRRRELQSLFARTFADQVDALDLALHFRDSGQIGANAFALPSGDLVFTDAIVNLAASDQELLAVMAHEIGHIHHRHTLRRIIQNSFFVVALAMLTGDSSSAASIVLGAPVMVMEMAYSRRFEVEADNYALQFMRAHRIPTVNFSNIMQRMQWLEARDCSQTSTVQQATATPDRGEQGSEDEAAQTRRLAEQMKYYLSTHPLVEDRIRAFGAPTVKRTDVNGCPAPGA